MSLQTETITDSTHLLQRSHTQFLTGIRGYAALGVVGVHCTGAFKGCSDMLDGLLNFGKYGVLVFFVLSAFSLSISMNQHPPSEKKNLWHYFSRRFWRIVPLYFLVCLLCWCVPILAADGASGSMDELLMHLSFLNVFNHQYANSLIGVEWTVPLEMLAYLFLPVMFFVTKRLKWKWGILITIILYVLGKQTSMVESVFPADQTFYVHELSLVKYLFAFFAGAMVFNRMVQMKSHSTGGKCDVWVLCLLIFLPLFAMFFSKSENLVVTVWVLALIYALLGAGGAARKLFENRLILQVGKVSFSIYLLHLPLYRLTMPYFSEHVGEVAGFGLFVCLLFGVSIVSYHLVEEKFVRLGECLFKRCSAR